MTRTLCMLAVVAAAAGGCGDDDEAAVVVDGGGGTGAGGADAGGMDAGGAGGSDAASMGGARDAGGLDAPVQAQPLYMRLGGEPGLRAVVTDFVVNRVLKDSKINGYFLNRSVDGGKVIDCLVRQLGAMTGGPQQYPSMGCRDMKASHRGLGISTNDFNDLAVHLVGALNAAKVASADVDTIVKALMPMADDIVEDKGNNATVYQRIGRKPAVEAVVSSFIKRVVADARINGFFGTTNAGRLQTCLVRQVCGIDGPCRYGQEVDGAEPGVSSAMPCRDMRASHAGLVTPAAGGTPARGIGKADFDALVEDLVIELDAAKVSAGDKMGILGALAPMCDDIVAGGAGCPGKTVVGLTSANTLVTFDTTTPSSVTAPVAVSGVPQGEVLVGLTLRPANGKLYALGASSRLYELDRATGIAKAVGPGPFSPALMGTNFGLDFNPTVDRIRVVSDAQQNLRLHPDLGTVVDFDPMTAGIQPDANLNPAGAVGACAYTNSFAGSKMTTLFGIDHAGNALVRVGGVDGTPSPNAGAVTRVGPLGIDATAPVAFDIAPAGNVALAVTQVGGVSRLYKIDLATGAATDAGALGGSLVLRAIVILP